MQCASIHMTKSHTYILSHAHAHTQLVGNVQNVTDPIQCKVKLAGSNVLEGIKQCVVMGSVTLPVPQSLTCMPGLASTSVTLETDSPDQNHSYTDTGQNT